LSDFLTKYIFHWIPSKAIWISGRTLSWDARCSGIYIGFGIGILFHIIVEKKTRVLPAWSILILCVLLLLPLFIDVYTVSYGLREPSNDIRYLTGLLLGSAFSAFLYPAFIKLSCKRGQDRPAISSLFKFSILLLLIISAFLLKEFNSISAFFILEALSILGFFCLVAIITSGIFKVLKDCFVRCVGKVR
jgi:uncharacterized membrane protein